MKLRITWSDTDLNEAQLHRGYLWWRRVAEVYRDDAERWRFRNSDFAVAWDIDQQLRKERAHIMEYGSDLDWHRPRSRRETARFGKRLRLMNGGQV